MPTQEETDARAGWDALAAGFDRHTTTVTMPAGDDVLRFVDLEPGTRLLDVATGSGALAIPAARRGADVLGVDISPAMIERLRERAEREGLADLDGRVMDARSLELGDDEFDVAASLNGASILPEPGRALRELVRVTRPGGQVLVVNFGDPARAEWLAFFVGALRAVVADLDGPPPSPAFQLADRDRMREELRRAGFRDPQVETTTWRMELHSGRQFWDVVRFANPMAHGMVARLSEEQATAVREVLDGMLREHSSGRLPARLDTELNVGVGRA